MADYWIKLYHDILDDPKMATLSDNLWRRIIELFLLAGRLYKDGNLPEIKQIAWALRQNENQLADELEQITHTGIISKTETGWFIPKFKTRQDPMSNTERVRKFRETKQHEQYNADETIMKRNVTQITDNILQITDNITDTEDAGLFSETSKLSELSKTFETEMRMPVKYPDRWMEAIRNMFHAGVTPQILKDTIYQMNNPGKGGKVLTIGGPWSCEAIAISKASNIGGISLGLRN